MTGERASRCNRTDVRRAGASTTAAGAASLIVVMTRSSTRVRPRAVELPLLRGRDFDPGLVPAGLGGHPARELQDPVVDRTDLQDGHVADVVVADLPRPPGALAREPVVAPADVAGVERPEHRVGPAVGVSGVRDDLRVAVPV